MSSTNFYVYVYLDPRKPGNYTYSDYKFDYEPFYVGKGKENRIQEHLQEWHLKNDGNKFKINKIKKIIKETKQNPIIIKYKENLTEKLSFDLETKMIKTIGRIDLENGPLTNLSEGGTGSSGRIHSDTTKQKISISNTGKIRTEKFKENLKTKTTGKNNHNYGKPMSEKQKKQISDIRIKNGKSKGANNSRAIYKYYIIDKNNQFEVDCLKLFCLDNNLIYSSVNDAVHRNKPYKGYIIIRKLKDLDKNTWICYNHIITLKGVRLWRKK